MQSVQRLALVALGAAFALPMVADAAPRVTHRTTVTVKRQITPVQKQKRYTSYHRHYVYRDGRYWNGNDSYYYYNGRYYPDNRAWRNNRVLFNGVYYEYRNGRYWHNGRYYYYYNDAYYPEDSSWEWNGDRVVYGGATYVYTGGRWYSGGRYWYWHRGRWMWELDIAYHFAEGLERRFERQHKALLKKNPGVPGRIHYICKKWDAKNELWVYYRNAYRPDGKKVSGPYALAEAEKRVKRLNQASRGEDEDQDDEDDDGDDGKPDNKNKNDDKDEDDG